MPQIYPALPANTAQNDPDAVVLVSYYGVRSQMFDTFPNIISMKVVDRGYTHIPWFNILFILLFAAAIIFLLVKIRRLKKKISGWLGRDRPQAPPTPAES